MLSFDHVPGLAVEGPPHEPHGIHVIIETPRESRSKIAWNEKLGLFEYSRTLRAGCVWPCDFGFVPNTLAGDGDALDVALWCDAPLYPGVLVRARVIGGIGLVKNGLENNRLIAVPARSHKAASRFDTIADLDDVAPRQVRELEAFLSDYNTFEGHTIRLTGWMNAAQAWKAVGAALLMARVRADASSHQSPDVPETPSPAPMP